MNNNVPKVIFGGASITQSPWPSWADLTEEKYHGTFFNTGKVGFGNEAIVTNALHQAFKLKDVPGTTIIILMLTNIDKWDWYVDDPELVEKFGKEKHTITKLDKLHRGGFWSTGSWFPLEKELFKKNFYSQDYFVMKTLQLIGMFNNVCQTQNWTSYILFDSPIFSMLEDDIRKTSTIDCYSNKLVMVPEVQWLYESLNIKDQIYHPGLIGFLAEQNLPWFSEKYKFHPGTDSHYKFAKKYLFPVLDKILIEKTSEQNLLQYVTKMDRLWTQ